jgi:hypothetical protein
MTDAANEKRDESARFEVWMDATRAWWRKWSPEERAACSQRQIADMMREAFEAGFNTNEPAPQGNKAVSASADYSAPSGGSLPNTPGPAAAGSPLTEEKGPDWKAAYWRLSKNLDIGNLADYDDELASEVRELREKAQPSPQRAKLDEDPIGELIKERDQWT